MIKIIKREHCHSVSSRNCKKSFAEERGNRQRRSQGSKRSGRHQGSQGRPGAARRQWGVGIFGIKGLDGDIGREGPRGPEGQRDQRATRDPRVHPGTLETPYEMGWFQSTRKGKRRHVFPHLTSVLYKLSIWSRHGRVDGPRGDVGPLGPRVPTS